MRIILKNKINPKNLFGDVPGSKITMSDLTALAKRLQIVPRNRVIIFYYHGLLIDPNEIHEFPDPIIEFEYNLIAPHIWEQQLPFLNKAFFFHGLEEKNEKNPIPDQIIEEDIIKIHCPFCHLYTPQESIYCEHCGQNLQQEH